MIEVTDSGFTPENIADAEWLWTNLPTFPRNWSSLPTHEKALIVHTAARHRIEAAKAERDRLRERLRTTAFLEKLTNDSCCGQVSCSRSVVSRVIAALEGEQHERR